MTHLGLLIGGFASMLVFWALAAWLWTTAARGASRGGRVEGDPSHAATTIEPLPTSQDASAIPMQFRRLQSAGAMLLTRQRQGSSDAESRVRRNCMIVDVDEPGVTQKQIPERPELPDDGEIERRATGVFFVHADSPRPRGADTAQELANQPYRRAGHGVPANKVGEQPPLPGRRS